MKRMTVVDYDYNNNFECTMAGAGKRFRRSIGFINCDLPRKGAVIYIPDRILTADDKVFFGPIGVSPLARSMPMGEFEFLLLQNKGDDAVLLQRYYVD